VVHRVLITAPTARTHILFWLSHHCKHASDRQPDHYRNTAFLIETGNPAISGALSPSERRGAALILIDGAALVATTDRPTKGRLRWPPSIKLCRSRTPGSDGSVADNWDLDSSISSSDERERWMRSIIPVLAQNCLQRLAF
jgi:hypothetical protein